MRRALRVPPCFGHGGGSLTPVRCIPLCVPGSGLVSVRFWWSDTESSARWRPTVRRRDPCPWFARCRILWHVRRASRHRPRRSVSDPRLVRARLATVIGETARGGLIPYWCSDELHLDHGGPFRAANLARVADTRRRRAFPKPMSADGRSGSPPRLNHTGHGEQDLASADYP